MHLRFLHFPYTQYLVACLRFNILADTILANDKWYSHCFLPLTAKAEHLKQTISDIFNYFDLIEYQYSISCAIQSLIEEHSVTTDPPSNPDTFPPGG